MRFGNREIGVQIGARDAEIAGAFLERETRPGETERTMCRSDLGQGREKERGGKSGFEHGGHLGKCGKAGLRRLRGHLCRSGARLSGGFLPDRGALKKA
jgi:hypothetical protein